MPASSSDVITVALLGTPAVSAATLYGFFDILAGTRRDWQMLHGGEAVDSPFRPRVVSRDGLPFEAGNGVRITPDDSFAECPRPDIVCVTDLMLPPGAAADGMFDAELRYLRQAWDAGATLCSSCSGALLLAGTGLLDGHDATSHWAYCDLLARDYPRTRWNAERMLVVTGPQQRIMMAGSGAAWHLLALALIARFASPEEAMQVARVNLLATQDVSALAYSSLTRGSRAEDPVVARCQVWAADHYGLENPVSQLVSLSGLPERTFKRRFTEATGMAPLEYIHMLRLEEAKQLLESTELPVEAVAVEVGYQDASFFSRLFRRKVALTPAHYRRRFGALNEQLRRVAAG
ncbi:helix-turn-helix domain-containing protein [Ramlibacter solisilvae]|uniref:AraC family transcriptional regulator n=1 Tax=Ramlibacter tataouinensis TaxID=94132 RepID=A0A127K1L4_9BURK|nr:helix-turn-helix domain-containing protein [Ramlibacter tataouinensis]AMO25052.1 AraC family transcriptional regulator [Ramlibacter tataouinensis]